MIRPLSIVSATSCAKVDSRWIEFADRVGAMCDHLTDTILKMHGRWFATVLVAMSFGSRLTAEAPQDAAAIDYDKSKGLVAAAYRGGQVVVWEFDSGRVRNIFNAPGSATAWNSRIARFSPDGRFIAYTAEGDAGLIAYNLDQDASTPLVPR